jgi:hypothetical protein
MAAFDNNQYKAFLDEPNETLAVEYKGWLDLSVPTVRADLARHIAVLANYGGGTIVLGITDAMHTDLREGKWSAGRKQDHRYCSGGALHKETRTGERSH